MAAPNVAVSCGKPSVGGRARPIARAAPGHFEMAKEKIQRTVGVYDRPEKKSIPWTVVVVAAVVIVAVAVAVFLV